jgi:vacuolar protein sorting-associated protein 13A/C
MLALARDGYAPYRISNRTGSHINIWGDTEGTKVQDVVSMRIQNNEVIDWRFDDWKTMREVRSPLNENMSASPQVYPSARYVRWEP